MKKILLILAVAGSVAIASAEVRTWTLKNGKTIEGEMVRTYLDKMVLVDADGKEATLPKDAFRFSDADREYMELEDPPKFKIEIKKSVLRKNFSMIRGSEDRPPEQRAEFGAKVSLENKKDYTHELTVEYFAIGDEIKGDRYILLDRKKSTFTPSKENKWTHEFYSKRLVRMTDLWDNSTVYSRRGEQYAGFVITVRDKRGKLIGINASREWMENSIENLEQLKIGNYMNELCQRTYPTRPKSYIASLASGRQ